MSIALVGFRIAARALPAWPAPFVAAFAYLIGWGSWIANASGRRAVRANLRVVLRRPPTAAEVRAVFVTAAQNYADLFALPGLPTGDLLERVEVEGWENLAEALARERGALLAALHLGNLEVVGRVASRRGVEVVLPVERLEPPELLDLMIRLRERAGFRCEPVGTTAIDRVREALRRNQVVGIGVDRMTLGEGDLVTFEGRPARMPVAAALLARRTGAPLLPYASRRLPGRRLRVRIGAPIPVARTGHLRADLRTTTEHLLDALGADLRDAPTQWVIFHRIWEPE
ncbi:MAG: lysophospholipid acyltransferase family protein [Chloroflexota bacterium]